MSSYEVIKGQLQMPPPPPPHQWLEAKKKTGLSGFKYSRLKMNYEVIYLLRRTARKTVLFPEIVARNKLLFVLKCKSVACVLSPLTSKCCGESQLITPKFCDH